MNRKVNVLFVVLLIGLLSSVVAVQAQKSTLDPAADPNYGAWTLSDYPDPLILTLQAGGDMNAADADVGAGCTGFMTSQPDIVLEWTGGDLRVFFASEGDTTLVVNLPDGTFLCNDDTVGANPVVDVPNAESGNYAVWLGTFNEGSLIPGYFVATGGSSLPGALASDLLGSATSASVPQGNTTTTTTTSGDLDSSGTATFAALSLAPGFTPDPTEVEMVAGGGVDVTAQNLGGECRGFVANAPDVTIDYTQAGRFLRVFFQSTADTTLVVQLPDGSFACNDDFPGGLDPLVDISAPAAGTYSIWVGTFSATSPAPGTLYLSSGNTADPTNTGL